MRSLSEKFLNRFGGESNGVAGCISGNGCWGKEGAVYYSTSYESPLGTLTLSADGDHLVGLWMEGQKYFGGTIPEEMKAQNDIPVFRMMKEWLDCYFAGSQPPVSKLPLAPIGSGFRQEVWNILCEIPYGGVTTYGAIAKKMAAGMDKKSMSSQAVGGAVGHNPISIVIPCHRVVGADGSLTGYAGGIDKKIKLLELEGVDLSSFFVPNKGAAL